MNLGICVVYTYRPVELAKKMPYRGKKKYRSEIHSIDSLECNPKSIRGKEICEVGF